MEPKTKKMRTNWHVPASNMSRNTFNPIRSIVDGMKLTPNPDKPMIALSIGDPTVFNNLPFPEELEDAVISKIKSRKFNGYNPSSGYEESRQAVAEYSSHGGVTYTAKDVILTSGCSMALDLCISVLANKGQNILIPKPGFSIYKTLAESHGINVKYYNLLPEASWEIDLDSLEACIDDKTVAILINNPSNPCGSVFNKKHLLDILATAHKHKVPIISDEIYEHFIFSGNEYHALGSLTEDVPILSCSGLTKRFLVPGWRLGWIVIKDCNEALAEVRKGLISLTQRLLGPNSLIQSALPDILKNTPENFYTETLTYVEDNANKFYKQISAIPGLVPIKPQGAMYMMNAEEVLMKLSKDEFSRSVTTYKYSCFLPNPSSGESKDEWQRPLTLLSQTSSDLLHRWTNLMYQSNLEIKIDIENFPGIKDDVDFTEKLVTEQSVFCLPAKCFQFPNFFRIVLTIPTDKVEVACSRIREFCQLHYNPTSKQLTNGNQH